MTDVPSVSPDNGISPSTSGENGRTPLDELRDTIWYGYLVDKMQLVAVGKAREEGATWEQIGKALGVTHQAARQRWASRIKALSGSDTA